jgi:hypothetical protein
LAYTLPNFQQDLESPGDTDQEGREEKKFVCPTFLPSWSWLPDDTKSAEKLDQYIHEFSSLETMLCKTYFETTLI